MDYTMAIKLAKEAKEPSAIYYVNRANSYFEQQKYNECLNDCKEAKDIDPSYKKVYWRVAKVMEILDKRDTAIGVMQQAFDMKCFNLEDKSDPFTKYLDQLKEDL